MAYFCTVIWNPRERMGPLACEGFVTQSKESLEEERQSSRPFLGFPWGKRTFSYRETYGSGRGNVRFRTEKHRKWAGVFLIS